MSLNLPQIGILAKGDEKEFWELMDERLELCREALMCRHRALLGTTSDVSPVAVASIGAIFAPLAPGEEIDPFLEDGLIPRFPSAWISGFMRSPS